jgi:dimethylaniline monooxygenase (N-oxide forming)
LKIYRDDIAHASEHALHLSDETLIYANVLVYATGHSPSSPHDDQTMAVRFGLPIPKSAEDPQQRDHWQDLEQAEDVQVCKLYPVLAKPPSYHHLKSDRTPFRLYEAILSIRDHDIVFHGKISSGNKFRIAEAEAM